jgi:hypothetical protein
MPNYKFLKKYLIWHFGADPDYGIGDFSPCKIKFMHVMSIQLLKE